MKNMPILVAIIALSFGPPGALMNFVRADRKNDTTPSIDMLIPTIRKIVLSKYIFLLIILILQQFHRPVFLRLRP